MSGRLGEIESRIAATHQLDAVIAAMRGIAASRSHEAHARLAGIRAAAQTAGAAIGEVLAFAPEGAAAGSAAARDNASGGEVCIVIGTEQGFVGALNDELAGHALRHGGARACRWLLVGSRLASAAASRGLACAWSAPMVAHPEAVPPLAVRMTDAVYARFAGGMHATRVSVVSAQPGESRVRIAQRTLVPFDLTRFRVPPRPQPPLVNVAPARLLSGLVEFYVFVQLCEALMLSFAAENEARVRAMLAARANVQQRLSDLTQHYRALRQEEITSEIVELSTGGQAARRTTN
ncbi:ATP synthase gamma chain [Paraburkholderia caffeinitolerans]|uniref:ATP synthase gamma chain n=1 Tax=Paraburkholderia caffeinitolerans TaxID=1723730 RepID=A0A6J5FXB7_9BURK|nr:MULTISPECIES: FoF1 ATP synthase subunit gamma [Paraburkholderia]CAB3788980.1 ATP synthase gamma chain [Paraburkholderia caffeinitolerans]